MVKIQCIGLILIGIGFVMWIFPRIRKFIPVEGFKIGHPEVVAQTFVSNGHVTDIHMPAELSEHHIENVHIRFSGGDPTRPAQAIGVTDSGRLVGVLITDSGSGYRHPPQAIFMFDSTSGEDHGNHGDHGQIIRELNQIKSKLDDIDHQKGTGGPGGPGGTGGTGGPIADPNPKISTGDDQPMTPQRVQELSSQYQRHLDEVKSARQPEINKAKQLLADYQREQVKAREANQLAKKYGLPPPPSTFTPSELTKARQTIQSQTSTRQLTPREQAQCMVLLNDVNEKKSRADDLGQRSESQSYLIPSARQAGQDAEDAVKKYQSQCQNPTPGTDNFSPGQI